MPPSPAPLTPPELERLWRWERHMIAYYTVAMIVLAGAISLALSYGETPWVRRSLLGVVVVLMLVGAYVQFRERCPRCAARIGKQSRLLLPDKCATCGVIFERPPRPAA